MICLTTFDKFKKEYQSLTKTIYGTEKGLPKPSSEKGVDYVMVEDEELNIITCCIYYSKTKMRFESKEVVCFGHFESFDDEKAVRDLVSFIEGKIDPSEQVLLGPINGNTWNSYRIAQNHDQTLFPMDIANPLYYSDLLEQAGMEVVRTYSSHIVSNFDYDQESVNSKMERLSNLGVTIRNINLDQFDSELNLIYKLCMKSFKNSFLFSPIRKEEFKKKYLELKAFLQAEYIWMAMNSNDQLVGLMFALSFPGPDGTRGYMAKTLARLPESKYAGIGSILSGLLQKKAIEDQCSFGIHAFMEESNVSNIISTNFSGNEAKEYVLYKLKDT